MSSAFLTTKFSFAVNGKAILQYFWCDEITKLDVVNHISGDYYTMQGKATKKPCGSKKNKERIPNRHAQSWLMCPHMTRFLPSKPTVYSITWKTVITVSLRTVHTCLAFLLLILSGSPLILIHTTRLSTKFLECSWSMKEHTHLDDWFVTFQNIGIFSSDLIDSCLQILYWVIMVEG